MPRWDTGDEDQSAPRPAGALAAAIAFRHGCPVVCIGCGGIGYRGHKIFARELIWMWMLVSI